MLATAVLAWGAAASLAAFYFAYSEAQEFQDDTLRQISMLSAGGHAEIRRLDAASKSINDPESRIQVIRLPDGPRPHWLPVDVAPGFHTLKGTEGLGEMRVFVRGTDAGGRLVIAQPTGSRNEIALSSALYTLLPLLILLAVLTGLITFIVRGELKSLRQLSENLDQQAGGCPAHLPAHDLPEEIAPFVEAINRLLARVDKLIGEQRRFIADAAHELRTPLTALALQAQNLAQVDSPEALRQRLIPLQAGIERARRLTVQLLDLARLQTGEPALVEIDVREFSRELIVDILPLASAKGIDLGMDERNLKTMWSDPQTLRLTIRNALENAIKYTPHGGEVTIRLSRDEEKAVIEIIDNGPGIPPAELQNAFAPFHRLSDTGDGSGLGLAISQEAASRLGGTVVLSNREGRSGLVFRYVQAMEPKM